MAHVMSDTTDTTPRPSMDRLTHAVIKETSKSLKYYIDIKRRENAFVLNPNSSVFDSTPPLRTRFIYGIAKENPSLNDSYHADKDFKGFLPNFEQKHKEFNLISTSPEKQMCREELNFHMRSYNFSPREKPKFSELRLRPPTRSISSCSITRDIRPRSAFKLTRHQQDQLIDDTANILASMIKTRQTIYGTNLLTQQTPPIYISRNVNPSPRQSDDQSIQPSITYPINNLRILTKRQSTHATPVSIIQKPKLITQGFLCEYKVLIITGNCNGASTNAPIRIKFFGINGCTNFYELIQSETHRIPFLKDQTDLFTVQTYHVGQLTGITIGHDRQDMRSSWFLSKISIDDPIRDTTYNIPCNTWLSIKSNDQKTMRYFQVISWVAHKKQIDSDEHRDEHESQFGHSTRTSSMTSPSGNELLNDNKKSKKQQHVSIGPTTVGKRASLTSKTTNTLSQSSTTIETLFNRNELQSLSVADHQNSSPILSTTSSDAEIEGDMINRTPSTTTTPSPTFNHTRLQTVSEHDTLETKIRKDIFKRQSINHDRPPARLEKRTSPLSLSHERPNKNKEKNQ